MKRKGLWKKILKMVLCFPIMPIMGIPGEGGGAGAGDGGVDTPADNPAPAGTPAEEPAKEQASFTQDQVNALMRDNRVRERAAVMSTFGIDETADPETVKSEIAAYQQWKESQRTDVERASEEVQKKDHALAVAKSENALLELKLECSMAKVKPEFIDDAIALIQPKITDDQKAADILNEMKTRYPVWFDESTPPESTGMAGAPRSNLGNGKQGASTAERLAKQNKPNTESSYFGK